MYKYQGFEDDSLFNRKPAKRFYGWRDMRKSRSTSQSVPNNFGYCGAF